MTKKNKTMYENWERATMKSIYDAYERPSHNKVKAYERCEEDRYMLDGWDARIPSKNTFGFTYAFLFSSKETGELMMYYATKDNTYVFSL